MQLKEDVLGKSYELSVAFVGAEEARAVTWAAKHKDKASNVLSFPLSKTSGEIVLCPETAREQCADHYMDSRTFLAYLYIHGLFHLKGLDHGDTMEREERRIMHRFGLSAHEQNRHRN